MSEIGLWRRYARRFDWVLVLTMVAIATIGLVNLFSATRGGPHTEKFNAQVIGMIGGVVLFTIMAVLDYRLWIRAAWIVLAVCLALVVAVHFAGVVVKGSRRWIGPSFFRIQPSEFIKIGIILALARFVHDKQSGELTLPGLIGRFAFLGMTVLLVASQPDLGTASLIALICVSVGALVLKNLWIIAAGMGALVASLPLLWAKLHDYQRERVLTFLDPSRDPTGKSWHTNQSILAIGSGRVTGKGYGHATQNKLHFLPEHWTDFPFAVWAEEWGFLGSLVLIGLYFFLILWVLNVASSARDKFGATICLGVAALLFWHVLVNISMVMGMAPVVGVTLPLVSFGRSSLFTTFIALGLVASVSMRRFSR